MKVQIYRFFWMLCLLCSFCSISWAEINPDTELESLNLFEKARRRVYPGGADEDNLVVLERLPTPKQKITHRSLRAQVLANMEKEKEKEKEKETQEATEEIGAN